MNPNLPSQSTDPSPPQQSSAAATQQPLQQTSAHVTQQQPQSSAAATQQPLQQTSAHVTQPPQTDFPVPLTLAEYCDACVNFQDFPEDADASDVAKLHGALREDLATACRIVGQALNLNATIVQTRILAIAGYNLSRAIEVVQTAIGHEEQLRLVKNVFNNAMLYTTKVNRKILLERSESR